MTAERGHPAGRRGSILPLVAWLGFAATGCATLCWAVPPVPSTGAPHPSAPVMKVAGMTLEIRQGRLVVTEVAKGSPAASAGVLPLDVVLVCNGHSLIDLEPITPHQAMELLKPGPARRTRLVLGRGAGTLTIDLPQGGDPPPRPAAELKPGARAPEFSGTDLNGRTVALKTLLGKPVLIDFWASNCPPCEKAVIPVRRLAVEHDGRLQIVGVSLDEDPKTFAAFVYNHHLPGVQILDGGGWRGPIARLYGVPENGIPYYVLLDARGRVAALGDLEAVEEAIPRLAAQTR